MTLSENMTQKSDYQLRWITSNKATYSESQIRAALKELKSRDILKTNSGDIMDYLKKLWDSFTQFFK